MSSSRADLVALDGLQVVDEEHPDPGDRQQLVELRSVGVDGVLLAEPVPGVLADPVGLVADQHVEGVVLGVEVGVEELEHARPHGCRPACGRCW
jgi:hypothetical protein